MFGENKPLISNNFLILIICFISIKNTKKFRGRRALDEEIL